MTRPTDPACESCTHWRSLWGEDDEDDNDWSYRAAGNVIQGDDRQRWGTCLLIGLAYDSSSIDDDVKAFTKDGSDFMAHLHTRSDFGCVLHRAREET